MEISFGLLMLKSQCLARYKSSSTIVCMATYSGVQLIIIDLIGPGKDLIQDFTATDCKICGCKWIELGPSCYIMARKMSFGISLVC